MLSSSLDRRFVVRSIWSFAGMCLVTLWSLGGCKTSGVNAAGADVKVSLPGWNESHDVNSREVATAAFGVTNSCFAKAHVGTKIWTAPHGDTIESFAGQLQGTLKKVSAGSTDLTAATTAIFASANAACGEQVTQQATAQTQSSYSQFTRVPNNSAYVLTGGGARGSSPWTSILFVYTNESNMPELMQLSNGGW